MSKKVMRVVLDILILICLVVGIVFEKALLYGIIFAILYLCNKEEKKDK